MENIENVSMVKAGILRYYEKYMVFMGVAGQFMFYFQAYEIYRRGSSEGVSFLGFLIGFFCVFSWFVYGVLIKNKVLIISNAVATLGALLVVIGSLLY